MAYNFRNIRGLLLVCLACDSVAAEYLRRSPRDYALLLSNAVSTIDSPESLADFQKVIDGQMSTMNKELTKSSSELKQYETQFKQELESLE